MASTFSLKSLDLPRSVSPKAATNCDMDSVAHVLLSDDEGKERRGGAYGDHAAEIRPELAVSAAMLERMDSMSMYDSNYEKEMAWLDFFIGD
jgi:hypothetical protein